MANLFSVPTRLISVPIAEMLFVYIATLYDVGQIGEQAARGPGACGRYAIGWHGAG